MADPKTCTKCMGPWSPGHDCIYPLTTCPACGQPKGRGYGCAVLGPERNWKWVADGEFIDACDGCEVSDATHYHRPEDAPQVLAQADSDGATAPDAIGLARTVLGHVNDWATMDPAAAPFGWIANETAAALRALEGVPEWQADARAALEKIREATNLALPSEQIGPEYERCVRVPVARMAAIDAAVVSVLGEPAVIERQAGELAELRQEYADYQENAAATHRFMVDEADRLEAALKRWVVACDAFDEAKSGSWSRHEAWMEACEAELAVKTLARELP